MSKFKYHFFVCTNTRPPFAKPSCGPNGGHPIAAAFQEALEKQGLLNEAKVTPCGCLGPCENGPVVVVYPEATWYAGVKPEDVAEIIESHIKNGKPVKRFIYQWPETTS
ncbi:MAG TPA: (2Fe-2S) ferredoxin domain-containing protein [bacterium]